MHWIGVGILIWIGLAIAPAVIGLVLVTIPFVIGAVIGGAIGASITQGGGGLLLGALLGGILPYWIYSLLNK
jgi:hypothetical protein